MPTIVCPSEPSTTGAYRLTWKGEGDGAFTLREEGRDEPVYVGRDVASTMSGQKAGTHRYTIEQEGIAATDSCEVAVDPPQWGLVIGLFSAGLIVTLLTIGLILRGHRAHHRGDLG